MTGGNMFGKKFFRDSNSPHESVADPGFDLGEGGGGGDRKIN